MLIKVLNLDWHELSYASLVLTGLWMFMAMRARGEYLKTFRRSIDNARDGARRASVSTSPTPRRSKRW